MNLEPSLEFVGFAVINLVLFMFCLLCIVGFFCCGFVFGLVLFFFPLGYSYSVE